MTEAVTAPGHHPCLEQMTHSLVPSSSRTTPRTTPRIQRPTTTNGTIGPRTPRVANERRPLKRQALLHSSRDDRSFTNRPPKLPGDPQHCKQATIPTSNLRPPSYTNLQYTVGSNDEAGQLPDTDAYCTKNLWRRVMGGTGVARSTKASRAKERVAVRRNDSGLGSTDTGLTSTDSGRKPAKVTDADFEELVLKPRGISIDSMTKSITAFHHFGTPSPTENARCSHYHEIKGVESTTVWLEGEVEFAKDIVREYNSMDRYRLCEAEYATYAIEKLLKREIRNPELPETREWMTERMLQMTQKLEENFWEQPPVTDEAVPRKLYSFDVRPDCAYWVSLQAFNPSYRNLVGEYVSVKQKRILCPYLTIEFKKDDSTLARARYQVAVASALALYNRWQLKDRRLKAVGKAWSQKQMRTLKHYGLTFTGESYEFWCTEPNFDESSPSTWTGCRMSRVNQNACHTVKGVSTFVDWINEIHRWGLTVHGPACERDVKLCLHTVPGAERTSLGADDGVVEDPNSDGE